MTSDRYHETPEPWVGRATLGGKKAIAWMRGLIVSVTAFVLMTLSLSCSFLEEDVVECFGRLSGDRYCVKVPESTSCAYELNTNRVGCTSSDGVTTYPERFNFDDGQIWLPE